MISTLEVFSTPGGYHDKCEGRSFGTQLNWYGNPSVLTIPQCTHDIPQCTHDIPQCTHDIPGVLNDIPGVVNIPQCTAHPRRTAQKLYRVIY